MHVRTSEADVKYIRFCHRRHSLLDEMTLDSAHDRTGQRSMPAAFRFSSSRQFVVFFCREKWASVRRRRRSRSKGRQKIANWLRLLGFLDAAAVVVAVATAAVERASERASEREREHRPCLLLLVGRRPPGRRSVGRSVGRPTCELVKAQRVARNEKSDWRRTMMKGGGAHCPSRRCLSWLAETSSLGRGLRSRKRGKHYFHVQLPTNEGNLRRQASRSNVALRQAHAREGSSCQFDNDRSMHAVYRLSLLGRSVEC